MENIAKFSFSAVDSLFSDSLLDDFASISRPAEAWFLWRPNLKDEADNHIVELAVATNAEYIVTNNITDFAQAELQQVGHRVITPPELLTILRQKQ